MNFGPSAKIRPASQHARNSQLNSSSSSSSSSSNSSSNSSSRNITEMAPEA